MRITSGSVLVLLWCVFRSHDAPDRRRHVRVPVVVVHQQSAVRAGRRSRPPVAGKRGRQSRRVAETHLRELLVRAAGHFPGTPYVCHIITCFIRHVAYHALYHAAERVRCMGGTIAPPPHGSQKKRDLKVDQYAHFFEYCLVVSI